MEYVPLKEFSLAEKRHMYVIISKKMQNKKFYGLLHMNNRITTIVSSSAAQ